MRRSVSIAEEIGLKETDEYKYFTNEVHWGSGDGNVTYELVRFNKKMKCSCIIMMTVEMLRQLMPRDGDSKNGYVAHLNKTFDETERRLTEKCPEPTVSFQINERG